MRVSLGLTLIIATGGVDLSVGAVIAIAGSVAAQLLVQAHAGLATAILVTLGVCLSLGTWNGALVGWCGVQPIVATLILMVAGRGVAQLLTDGQIVIFSNPSFASLGNGSWLGFPIPVWIALTNFILVATVVRRTALGLFVEAVGNNPVASRF